MNFSTGSNAWSMERSLACNRETGTFCSRARWRMARSMRSSGSRSQARTATASSALSGTPKGTISSRPNFPSVSVPVLSVQTTVVEPSVSTLASLRTRTPAFESRYAPTLRKSASTSGNSSGSAAMARLMPVSSARPSPSPRHQAKPAMDAASTNAATPRRRTRRAVLRCSGVGEDGACATSSATWPNRVRGPVCVTSAVP